MNQPDHVIGTIDDGDVSYLGCRTCEPGKCPVMDALHRTYGALSAIIRLGYSMNDDWPSNADEAFEAVGRVLYPDA